MAAEPVVLFTLPPNTTHVSQPLDKGCFGPLKIEWKKVCHKLVKEGQVVTHYTFSRLFSEAWMRSITVKNILSGFCVTGIYPLDQSKLTGLGESDPTSESLELQSFNPIISRSPFARKVCKSPHFSEKEIDDFHHQYCSHDTDDMNEQYMQWKQMYCPYSGISVSKGTDSPLDSPLFHTPSKPESCVIMANRPSRSFQDTLKYPSPVPPEPKPTSRVFRIW